MDDDILELSNSDLEIASDTDPRRPVSAPMPHRSPHPDPLAMTRPPDMVRRPVNPEPLEDGPTRIEPSHDMAAGPTGDRDVDQCKVVIIGGNDRGREHVLARGDNSLGRGLDNHIVLSDIAVSRKHTLICWENTHFAVRDLGSGNGTLVNGKKIQHHVLANGDQVELGNTLVRYSGPASAANVELANQPTVVGDLGQMINTAESEVPAYPAAGHAQMTMATDGRRQASGGLSPRSRKLLLFGGGTLVILFAVLISLRLVLKKKPVVPANAAAQTSPDELAAQHFEEGTKQYRARNWEAARRHYLKVLAVAPGFDRAKRYADRSAQEAKARDALKQSKNALKAKDYTAARQELSKITTKSSYAGEARNVKQQVDDAQVQQLLESARLLRDSDDKEGALAKVNEALKIAPTNKGVLALKTELSGAAPPTKTKVASYRPRNRHSTRPRRPRASPSRPINAGAGAAKGLAMYRKRQWGPAYQELRNYANGLSGRRRRKGDALAEAARRVGQLMGRATNIQQQNPGLALKYYKEALSNDRKVPRKPHQAFIKSQLYKVARFQATSAFARGSFPSAYSAVKLAKKYGQMDAGLKRVLKDLERKASEIFTRGYTSRTSNPSKARRLWQTVLRMVPSSSPAYQKAYSWLNQSQPRYQDEDED